MPFPLFAAMAGPSIVQTGFGLYDLFRRRPKFGETREGRMLGRRASEGAMTEEQEETLQARIFKKLMATASEEEDQVRRALMSMDPSGKSIIGARYLDRPYRDVRGKLMDFEERLAASERDAATKASEQFVTAKEAYRERQSAERARALGQVASGVGGLVSAGAKYGMAKDMLGGPWGDYVKTSLLGIKPDPRLIDDLLWARKIAGWNEEEEGEEENEPSLGRQDSIFGDYLRRTGSF